MFAYLSNVHGQTVISGKVLDASTKETLPGVSLYLVDKAVTPMEKSKATIGTISDSNGQFRLVIPASHSSNKIAVSYIGYLTQFIDIGPLTSITILLKSDSRMLGETVVTGYQTISRKKATVAVSQVSADKIIQAGVQSIDNLLAGQLSGVSVTSTTGAPGAAPKIRVRGTSSLQATQDPLWVIDGMPVEGNDLPKADNIDLLYSSSIAGYNPSDIENITVLKDAAATAIYGARAANGVIVVTTKSGRKSEKVNVNYRNNFTNTPRPDISRLNLMNSNEKVDLELSLFGSNFKYRDEMGSVSQIFKTFNITPESYMQTGFAGINSAAQQEINALRTVTTDWNRLLFQSAFTQEHSLSVSGGGDRSVFYFSGGYFDEAGATRGTGSKRYNITLKGEYNLLKDLKLSTGIFANQRRQTSYFSSDDGVNNPISYSRKANPYSVATDGEGNYVYDKNVIGYETPLNFNILEELSNSSNNLNTKAFNANFKLQYTGIKGLSLSSQLGIQAEDGIVEKIALENTYYNRLLVDRNMRYDSKLKKKVSILPQGGSIINSTSELQQYTLKNTAEYDLTLFDKHQFNILAGNELRRVKNTIVSRRGFGYDPKTLTTQPVLFPSEDVAQALYKVSNFNIFTENAFVSFFGTGSYTYKNKYTLGASIRYDGSDLFGVDPKYKYLPLWSLSGLWRIAEEPYFKQNGTFDLINLRASYGLQGNIDKSTSPFVTGTYRRISILPDDVVNAIEIISPPNEKLRWEKTINYNIGLDLAFFNNRLSASIDFYNRQGKDLINIHSLPLESGFTSMTVNWAEMSNKGLEISILSRNITRKDFQWTSDFNLSFNKNKVLKETLPDNSFLPSRQGHPVGALFTLPYAGIDDKGNILMLKDGKSLSVNEFYKLTSLYEWDEANYPTSELTNDQQRALYNYSGTRDPIWFGGFNNTLAYKNFDLSFGLLFNLGHKVMIKPLYDLTSYNRGHNSNKAILDRWTPENRQGTYPALITGSYLNEEIPAEVSLVAGWQNDRGFYNNLDLWLKKADYVRVRNISLGYQLSKNTLSALKLHALRITAEARNPFVLMGKYDNYLDPETMGNPYAQPIPKTFSLGFNVTL